MFTPRVLRKRWVLALIFVCSLIYFITSVYKQTQYTLRVDSEPALPRPPPQIFHWPQESDVDKEADNLHDTLDIQQKTNFTAYKTCRNSVQGKLLITDDKGYVCPRELLVPGGCCNATHSATERYVCQTCLRNGCCQLYENCVSCCLQPEKQSLLRKILGQAQDSFQPLFASVTDHFELCLAKCRTSSQSVQHENSYRDPRAKYCYGEDPPDVQPMIPQ